MQGSILIISGPSGSGKSTLCKKMFEEVENIFFSISTTTRQIRDGEKDGIDYNFVSKKEFLKGISENQFLEWAEVHGNYYGTKLKSIEEALKNNKLIVFDIDVQGFELIKQSSFSEFCTSVFILPPNLSTLEARLEKRGTDSKDMIQKRIQNSKQELNYIHKYDYFIVNSDLNKASNELIAIAKSAKLKPKAYQLNEFLKNWLES
jgi:guanylate kinase